MSVSKKLIGERRKSNQGPLHTYNIYIYMYVGNETYDDNLESSKHNPKNQSKLPDKGFWQSQATDSGFQLTLSQKP